MSLLLTTLLLCQIGGPDDRPGPLALRDQGQPFVLDVAGSWIKEEEPEIPCQGMYLELNQGVFLAVLVHELPSAMDVKAAVQKDPPRWPGFTSWKVDDEAARAANGLSLMVQKVTAVVTDAEAPEDAQHVALRLVHTMFAATHVTIAMMADRGADQKLDQMAERVVNGLKPAGAKRSPPAAAAGHDEGGRDAGAGAAGEPGIDPRELEKLDPKTRAAVLRLLEQQKKGAQDVDERAPASEGGQGAAVPAGSARIGSFPATFGVPKTWRIGQQTTDVVLLVSDTEPGMIVLHAGIYASFDGMYKDLYKGFQQQHLTGQPTDGPRAEAIGDLPGTFASYQGQAQDGTPLAARFRAALANGGLGIMVCGITTPQQMAVQGPRVDEIARSFRLGELAPDRSAMAGLVGEWARYRGNSSGSLSSSSGGTSSSAFSSYVFRADGTYTYTFESSLSVAGAATSEGTQGQLFSGSNDHDQGRFFVVGGRLVLASGDGGSAAYDLSLQANLLKIGDVVYSR